MKRQWRDKIIFFYFQTINATPLFKISKSKFKEKNSYLQKTNCFISLNRNF